jgi:hypothetical protein
MSRTYEAPFTVNGERVGIAVIVEKNDGTLVVTSINPFRDHQEAFSEALGLHVKNDDVSINHPIVESTTGQ